MRRLRQSGIGAGAVNQASAAYKESAWQSRYRHVAGGAGNAGGDRRVHRGQGACHDLLQGSVTPELTASAASPCVLAQAELDTLQQAQPGELAEAEALVRQAQAGVELVVRVEEIAVAQGDVHIAIALLQDALVALAETELRAPFDGVITTLDIDSGEIPVAPNAPLLQGADLCVACSKRLISLKSMWRRLHPATWWT